MSCGVGHRCGSDPMLLWLWCRPAATARIRPLARELPYAAGAALKSKKKKKKVAKCYLLNLGNYFIGLAFSRIAFFIIKRKIMCKSYFQFRIENLILIKHSFYFIEIGIHLFSPPSHPILLVLLSFFINGGRN